MREKGCRNREAQGSSKGEMDSDSGSAMGMRGIEMKKNRETIWKLTENVTERLGC